MTFYRFLWSLIRPKLLGLLGCYFGMLLAALHPSLVPYILKLLIDRVNLSSPSELSHLLVNQWPYAIWIGSLGIGLTALRRIEDYLLRNMIPDIKLTATSLMFDRVNGHSHRFFLGRFPGQMSAQIKDFQSGFESLIETSIEAFRGLCTVLVAIIFLYCVHPLVALIFGFFVFLFLILGFYLYKGLFPLAEEVSRLRSQNFGRVVDAFTNHSAVKLFAREDFEGRTLRSSLEKMRTADRAFRLRGILTWSILGVIFSLCTSFLVLALLYLRQRELISIGDFAFVLWTAMVVLESTWFITDRVREIPTYLGSCRDSFSLLSHPWEIQDHPTATSLQILDGEIEFRNVGFQHPDARQILFDDFSMTIEGGSKVGFVGPSGAGKTTFTQLVVRLFDVNKGNIFIDGQDIAQVSQDSLRAQIGFIPQDPTLFHRTLWDNIAYGNPSANKNEVLEAAQKAEAEEFIQEAPSGYLSFVGERGLKLSGGQRQRIAIARAFLKNAPILILDEATSALDSHTEKLIQKSLKNLMAGKTCLVIAHRLSTLQELDRIVVLDQGKIVEDGTHESLLTQKGLYYSLWQTQAGGFLGRENGAGDPD